VPRGRLKLRRLSGGSAELIYYERADQTEPALSRYCTANTADPEGLKSVLSAALGVRGIVRKQRRVYRAGCTRIHLDEVDDLGAFAELEVELQGMSVEQGIAHGRDLMQALGIQEVDLVDCAYIDLLLRARRGT
jgi:adenylate cyclase class IV